MLLVIHIVAKKVASSVTRNVPLFLGIATKSPSGHFL